ncbi:MAG: hypothetical protein J1E84_07885 [Muribaculaceae bacterium]|nr:hypothetical protein [Muribaculaceae bacterium]
MQAWKQPPTTRLTARKSRANNLYALRAISQGGEDDRLRLADSYVMGAGLEAYWSGMERSREVKKEAMSE